MKKDIPEIKDEVDNIVTEAFNEYQLSRIKDLKRSLFKYKTNLKEALRRHDECETKLNSITTEELWKDFNEYNIAHQSSKHEEALK